MDCASAVPMVFRAGSVRGGASPPHGAECLPASHTPPRHGLAVLARCRGALKMLLAQAQRCAAGVHALQGGWLHRRGVVLHLCPWLHPGSCTSGMLVGNARLQQGHGACKHRDRCPAAVQGSSARSTCQLGRLRGFEASQPGLLGLHQTLWRAQLRCCRGRGSALLACAHQPRDLGHWLSM